MMQFLKQIRPALWSRQKHIKQTALFSEVSRNYRSSKMLGKPVRGSGRPLASTRPSPTGKPLRATVPGSGLREPKWPRSTRMLMWQTTYAMLNSKTKSWRKHRRSTIRTRMETRPWNLLGYCVWAMLRLIGENTMHMLCHSLCVANIMMFSRHVPHVHVQIIIFWSEWNYRSAFCRDYFNIAKLTNIPSYIYNNYCCFFVKYIRLTVSRVLISRSETFAFAHPRGLLPGTSFVLGLGLRRGFRERRLDSGRSVSSSRLWLGLGVGRQGT